MKYVNNLFYLAYRFRVLILVGKTVETMRIPCAKNVEKNPSQYETFLIKEPRSRWRVRRANAGLGTQRSMIRGALKGRNLYC